MSEYNYTVEGSLPASYPEPINYAWFPTNEACEKYDLPSFEGYLSILTALERHPELMDADEPLGELFEVLEVEDVENCTIITGF